MQTRVAGLLAWFFVSLALVSVGGRASAADKDKVAQQVTVLNRVAVAAYGDGDFKKMKNKLLEAVALGKDALAGQPMLARTYLHLGVLYVDGLEERAAGIKYFAQALKINPEIQITTGMATKTVTAAFEEAKGNATSAPPAAEAEAEEAPSKPAASAREERAATNGGGDDGRATKVVEAEKRRAAAELKESENQARIDKERLQKELARVKEAESKEHAENERLQSEMKRLVSEAKKRVQDAEGELKKHAQQTEAEAKKEALQAEAESKKQAQQTEAEAKRQSQQLDKERADKEKAVAEGLAREKKERADKEKAIAEGLAREKKERDAKEKAEKQVADKEKLLAEAKQALAEAKQRISQVEKEKADKDKVIAEGLAREKREREVKEKLEKEKLATDARESERKARQEKERVEREKSAAGPDVPSHFAEPIYCDLAEVAPAGVDLYVHCLAQPNVKAKTLSFFYRTTGSATYNAIVMEKSKKGWFMAMVPGERVTGRLLQYYAEARDGREDVVASNGKPPSPNILTLKSAARK